MEVFAVELFVRFSRIALLASLVAIVSACGGGGGSSPSTLSGVAAVGTPIVSGNINIVCATGTPLTTTTDINGAYSVSLAGETPPCAVQVSGGTINSVTNTKSYTSIATAPGTVNVTPLTDLIVANLVGATPSTWFSTLTPTQLTTLAITQTKVNTAFNNLVTALPALTLLSANNPITTAFIPQNGNVVDSMLSSLQAAIANNTAGVGYTNLVGNLSTNTPPAAGFNTALKTAWSGATGVTATMGASGVVVSFTAPANNGSSPISYIVNSIPAGITATGSASPITVPCPSPCTGYAFSVIANSVSSVPADVITNYNVTETFTEPMTSPHNSIFTGSFTFDSTTSTVSNLTGSLTEAMSGCTMSGCSGTMATVPLTYQLSAAPTTGGLLVTTFALNTTNTFSGGGFAPGSSTITYGNNNAYAMIFVNTTNPTTALTQAQINELAYADCTAGGMMGTTCMTGTTVAGYGQVGTMKGYPVSQVITNQNAFNPPTGVTATMGASGVVVSFTAPANNGGSPITGYTVTSIPAGITATGSASPITVSCPSPCTGYAFSVIAANAAGNSVPSAPSDVINNYNVTETFYEPMTQPDNTIFTGSFTFDSTTNTVSNLTGSLTEAMSGCMGMSMSCNGPMTTVPLTYQLSAVPNTTLGGLLVTTFALNTTNTFSGGGFAPGGTMAITPNNSNAYAMIFVNTTNPTTALTQAQINELAYADCTAGGMMGTTCMTGTTVAGYGQVGTMKGYPVSQVITNQ
jgi:hypothetical protein